MTTVPTPALDTIGEHATAAVPVAAPTDTVGATRHVLAGRRFDSAAHVAVCEGARLVGLVTVEALLAAPDDARLAEVMDADPPVVGPGVDQEEAAWHAVHADESCLAVVDADGAFRGLVPAPRLLQVLLAEHDEDLARFGGFLHDAQAARTATMESVRRRLWHRLPWLLLGLAGAMLAAAIVSGFEEQLEREVALAFFIPGIVYMADAVGTQTEALVIRGLSVGISIGAVVRREALTGVLLGIVLGAVCFPVALAVWDVDVASTVALALTAACATATVVAMALPWALHRLGRDPAFGSGPLATVVQDLLSLAIYFAVAAAIVGT